MSLFGLFGPPDVNELKAKRNVKGLIKALRYRKSVHIRETAAKILGEIKDIEAVRPLIRKLKDSESAVRVAAAWALGTIEDTRAVQPLIMALSDSDSNLRREAASALGRIQNDQAIEPLVTALRDSDSDVRWRAERALAGMNSPWVVELLIRALTDSDSYIRCRAAKLLGELKDVTAVEGVIMALNDVDNNVRREAARALSKIGSTQAVEPLIVAVKDSDTHVRKDAAEALGQIGDIRAAGPLIEALKSSDKDLQQAAVIALTKIKQDWATVEVAEAIVPLLIAICASEQALFLTNLYHACEISLIRIGTPAVEPLIRMLNEKARTRRLVVSVLGQISDSRAARPLVATLLEERKADNHMPLALTTEVLKKMLEQSGADFALDELRIVARLNDKYEFGPIQLDCGFTTYEGGEVNLAHLKQLARQELIRRGENA